MSEVPLEDLFPNMKPVKKAPGLGSVNGFGATMFGQRDLDEQTGAYVANRCFTILFVPVCALGAYRVIPAEEGGWYFIGKEPLSPIAKAWNTMLFLLAVAVISALVYNNYTSSPNYIASQHLEKASAAKQDGKIDNAARFYQQVMQTNGVDQEHRTTARQAFITILNDDLLDAESETIMETLKVAIQAKHDLVRNGEPDLLKLGIRAIEKILTRDVDAAFAISNTIRSLDVTGKELALVNKNIYGQLIEKHPDNTEYAIALASIYESEGDDKSALKILEPHRTKLGDTEGARVLGQIYVRQYKFDEAFDLLNGYTEKHLKQFHKIEKKYNNAYEMAYDGIVADLQDNRGPKQFYDKWESLPEGKRSAFADEYIAKQMAKQKSLEKLRQSFINSARVVHVAMDFGIVRLRRAQAMPSADQRKAELEEAERVFLAIGGIAGKNDRYRLFFGQMSYWLGKSERGKKRFDELLEEHKRSSAMLGTVAEILREVGEIDQARAMYEEAYNNAKTDEERFDPAEAVSILASDFDEKLKWVKLTDVTTLHGQANLAQTLGEKAISDGDEDEAIKQYRKAIAAYEKQPESSPSLNNTGLVYLAIYPLTNDPKDLETGTNLMRRAIALEPGNAILLMNIANVVTRAEWRHIVGKHVDLKLLKASADSSDVRDLHANAAEREPFIKHKLGRLNSAIDLTIHPANASYLVNAMWMAQIDGDTAKATQLRDTMTKYGYEWPGN